MNEQSYSYTPEDNRGLQLCNEARQLFNDRQRFLRDRERAIRYVFGEQWSDTIKLPDGTTMTEEEYILEDGRQPIVNNLIGKMVRTLVGQFRKNYPDPIVIARNPDSSVQEEQMTSTIHACLDKNFAKEIDTREFEEFLISAGFGWKTQYMNWDEYDSADVFIDRIDQTRFFFNVDVKDVRNFDVKAVGELIDADIEDVISQFAESREDEKRIRAMFPKISNDQAFARYPDYIKKYRSFYTAENPNYVRVIEYWKQESGWFEFLHDYKTGTFQRATHGYFERLFAQMGLETEGIEEYSFSELASIINEIRKNVAMQNGIDPEDKDAVPLITIKEERDTYFKAYWLSPLGHILKEAEFVYDHGSHPYDFGMYPLVDGRTMSLVYTTLDQQRFVNRLIQMADLGLSQSVKNLWAIDEDMIPPDMNKESFAEQFTVYNGIMYYRSKQGVKPPQPISSNSIQVGQLEMLKIMQEYLENISSVNDAAQGQQPNSGEPASLYALRVDNAAVANKDYFEYFYAIMRRRNKKVLKLIKQFYEERRVIRVAGTGFKNSVDAIYDPQAVRDLDFDVALGETQDTLVYRQALDNYLMQFLNAGHIDFVEFLENTTMPFADKLLQTVRAKQQELTGTDTGATGMEGMPQSQEFYTN